MIEKLSYRVNIHRLLEQWHSIESTYPSEGGGENDTDVWALLSHDGNWQSRFGPLLWYKYKVSDFVMVKPTELCNGYIGDSRVADRSASVPLSRAVH